MSSTRPHNMVNFGLQTAEMDPVVWGTLQISTGFTSWQRYCPASSSGRQPNFAALNRGRHLCSAGRPSRWALAHILVTFHFYQILSSTSYFYCVGYSCCVLSTWILNVRSICIAYEYGYEHYIALHKTFIVRNHTETTDCALLISWPTFTLLSLPLCLECYNRPYNLTPETCDNNYSPHPLTPTSCLRYNIQRITDAIFPCGCL